MLVMQVARRFMMRVVSHGRTKCTRIRVVRGCKYGTFARNWKQNNTRDGMRRMSANASTNSKTDFVQGTDAITCVNTVTEYDELKSLVVGLADYNFRYPYPKEDITFDYSCMLANEDEKGGSMFSGFKKNDISNKTSDKGFGNLSKDLIKRENENLNTLANTLMNDFGIKVYRPLNRLIEKCDENINYDIGKTDDWETLTYMQSHCPRDIILTVENKVILCPTLLRGRRFEAEYFYSNILNNISKNCSNVEFIDLRDKSILDNKLDRTLSNVMMKANKDGIKLSDIEISTPFFDAANVLKFDRKKLIYLVSCGGNLAGYKLLQNTLPDYEIIPLMNFYSGFHLDTTICILNKNTLMFNPNRCDYESCKNVFDKFGIKNYVPCPQLYDHGYEESAASSEWIGMNILSLNKELVVMDSKQHILADKLKEIANINSLMLPFNHARDFGGGPHCVTLDLERSS